MFLEDRLLEKLKGITINTEDDVAIKAILACNDECIEELSKAIHNHEKGGDAIVLPVLKSTVKRINNTWNNIVIKRADLYLKKDGFLGICRTMKLPEEWIS